MLVAEYLKIVLYRPVNQNIGKANEIETQVAVITGPFKGTTSSIRR